MELKAYRTIVEKLKNVKPKDLDTLEVREAIRHLAKFAPIAVADLRLHGFQQLDWEAGYIDPLVLNSLIQEADCFLKWLGA